MIAFVIQFSEIFTETIGPCESRGEREQVSIYSWFD